MCCLFGIHDYGHKLTRKQKTKILSSLSVASEERGTDATGIAYNVGGDLKIYKRPLPAHLLWFRIPEETTVVMGHTRMTTQGSERKNLNNHPFGGTVTDGAFALAHNGVLYNDKRLRQRLNLPATKVETDSYIAVQLLENSGALSFDTLVSMAEKLEGSFTITALSDRDELYFVKGDNPMCIYHYEKLGFYIYASTEEILKKALRQIPMKLGWPAKVKLTCGEILCIDAKGNQSRSHFDDSKLLTAFHSPWPRWYDFEPSSQKETSYLDDLKSVACYYGLYPEDVDALLEDGMSPEEIEEMLYCG